MTPLFACLPVCMTLSVIGLIGAVMLAFGLGNRIPGDDRPATAAAPGAQAPPPPLWVFPVVLLLAALLMVVLGLIWHE